jgi:hypothetical protein
MKVNMYPNDKAENDTELADKYFALKSRYDALEAVAMEVINCDVLDGDGYDASDLKDVFKDIQQKLSEVQDAYDLQQALGQKES